MPAATLPPFKVTAPSGVALCATGAGESGSGPYAGAPSRGHAAQEKTMLRIEYPLHKKADRHPQTGKWSRRVRRHDTEANTHSLSSPERVTAPPPARTAPTCAEPGCVQTFEAAAVSYLLPQQRPIRRRSKRIWRG